MAGSAGRLIYRTLAASMREQSRRLDFRSSWPSCVSLQGLAASGTIVDVGDLTASATMLEWEDLLQRPDVRDGRLVRSFFGSERASGVEADYPLLAAQLLGRGDPIDQGLAALRQVAHYAELVGELQRVYGESVEPPAPKPRAMPLLFAVGDVLMHRFFQRCVVVGWDATCQQGEEWVCSNRIRENLTFGTEQPFYHVLLEQDDVPRYCSQENLALLSDDEAGAFAHPHATFYFRSGSCRFEPTDALALVYPDDRAAMGGERDYRSLDHARSPHKVAD
jgi:hemimethylated DNA binding protein